jgi:hypothetical protein
VAYQLQSWHTHKGRAHGLMGYTHSGNLVVYKKIQILGNSKVIIDWINKKGNFQGVDIEGWKQKTRDLANSFQDISFQHIYRVFNKEADILSKKAFLEPEARLFFYQWCNGVESPHTHLDIFEV